MQKCLRATSCFHRKWRTGTISASCCSSYLSLSCFSQFMEHATRPLLASQATNHGSESEPTSPSSAKLGLFYLYIRGRGDLVCCDVHFSLQNKSNIESCWVSCSCPAGLQRIKVQGLYCHCTDLQCHHTSTTKLGQKRFLHALALSASLHLQVHKSIAVPVWEKSWKLIGSSVICIKRPTLIPHEEYNFLQFIICHLPVCFTPLNWLLNTSELFMSFGFLCGLHSGISSAFSPHSITAELCHFFSPCCSVCTVRSLKVKAHLNSKNLRYKPSTWRPFCFNNWRQFSWLLMSRMRGA